MKRLFKAFFCLSAILLVASCGSDSPFKGFEKMENGAYMKFYSKGDSDVMPRLKDEVTITMSRYLNDSLLSTTVGGEPMSFVLTEAGFKGDVVDGLLMMHVGDSARLAVSTDSVFIVMLQMDEIPEEYAGQYFYYDMKLLSVKPFETLEAERKAQLESLKAEEETYLAALRDDPNNTVTESGIIICEKTGKGKVAKMGEYIDFDFTLCDTNGDTLINTFGNKPAVIQYGDDFMGVGFNEVLGMLPMGGRMRFVIPSQLAFDTIGFGAYVRPYMPLNLSVRMNEIMDEKAYEKRQAENEAKMKAEMERRKAGEAKVIEEYLKSHGITESPTASGIYLIKEKEGDGALAEAGNIVSVHYEISNLNDEMIESSYDYGEPMTFTVGRGEMLYAIEEAVTTMSKGSKVKVITPSDKAFGSLDLGELLPPNSPMIIDLELVDIK